MFQGAEKFAEGDADFIRERWAPYFSHVKWCFRVECARFCMSDSCDSVGLCPRRQRNATTLLVLVLVLYSNHLYLYKEMLIWRLAVSSRQCIAVVYVSSHNRPSLSRSLTDKPLSDNIHSLAAVGNTTCFQMPYPCIPASEPPPRWGTPEDAIADGKINEWEDEEGFIESAQGINEVIDHELNVSNLGRDKIVLFGLSEGSGD